MFSGLLNENLHVWLDLDNLLSPSTSLGRSAGFLGSTARLTTGETQNFITMLWATLKVVMVPVSPKNWSTAMRPQMIAAGTSSIASTRPET